MLRNGVTLVDLPGHGDTNNERCVSSKSEPPLRIRNSLLHDSNQLAEEYLKRADCILLGESGITVNHCFTLGADLLQTSH